VHVSLPLRVINFLSIDPPPSSPLSVAVPDAAGSQPCRELNKTTPTQEYHQASPLDESHVVRDQDRRSRILQPVDETDEDHDETSFLPTAYEEPSDFADDDDSYFLQDQSTSFASHELEAYDLSSDHSQEDIMSTTGSASMDGYVDAAHFSDLYNANMKGGLSMGESSDEKGYTIHLESNSVTHGNSTERGDRYVPHEDNVTASSVRHPPDGARQLGAFILRVQEKLETRSHQINGDMAQLVCNNHSHDLGLQCSKSISELNHQADICKVRAETEDSCSRSRDVQQLQDDSAPSVFVSGSSSGHYYPSVAGCNSGSRKSGHDDSICFSLAGVLHSNQTVQGTPNPTSRLLPKPPVMKTIPIAEVSDRPSASMPVTTVEPFPVPRSVSKNEILRCTLKRPSLVQASSSVASVKAKVAALEMRASMERA
jgi:hypothetical protein